jgi:DNA-binding response OmpR family regulator
MRVLLVDDDPKVRSAVRAVLQEAGHKVSEASFGEAALARLRSEPPDVVLLDLVLPDAGGAELLGRIRGTPEAARVPVVAFTGYYSTPAEARAGAPGFDGYVVKPFQGRRLLDALAAVAPGRPRSD